MKIRDVILAESFKLMSQEDWQTLSALLPDKVKRAFYFSKGRDDMFNSIYNTLIKIKMHFGKMPPDTVEKITRLMLPYAVKEIDQEISNAYSLDNIDLSSSRVLAKEFPDYKAAIARVLQKNKTAIINMLAAKSADTPGATIKDLGTIHQFGLDWPELSNTVYDAIDRDLANRFDQDYRLLRLYRILGKVGEARIPLGKLPRLKKIADHFKEQLLWHNHTHITDVIWARVESFLANVKLYKQMNLDWPELANPTAYLKKHFEELKTDTIKELLSEVKNNTAGFFLLRSVQYLREVGINWPELAIVERSIKTDMDRQQLNENDKQFDQTVVDQLNAILPKPMRSRLESVNRFFFIAYFIDFLFDLQKAKFSESKKYQAFDLLKPIVYEYIEHYIKRLNDPKFAFTHFIDVIERLERLNKDYVEFDYTDLFERNKSAIIKMLLGSVRNYMETPDNVGRWRTYESYINFAKLISKLGLSWPELDKIVSSLASDRYVKTLDRPQSTLGAIADLVASMKRDRMTLQMLMPNARTKIESAKDRFINRNYFSFRWRDDIKFELDNTLLQYYRDLKSLGFEWPEIDQYLAASTTRERAETQKRQLVSSMLAAIKASEADGVPHGIKTLRTMGIDWPELAVIEKSINSANNKQIDEAAMSDEAYRYHASNIAYHIKTGEPAIALRYMGDRDITADDLDAGLRKDLEASKADAIRWLIKLFENDIFRFGRFIDSINRVKLDWPELAVLNRSFDSEYQKREEEFRRHRQY